MSTEPLFYWAITGRIPYDDEDTPFATPAACTRAEAVASFCQWLIDEELDIATEKDLRRRVDADATSPLTDHVYITSVFRSDTPIYHN